LTNVFHPLLLKQQMQRVLVCVYVCAMACVTVGRLLQPVCLYVTMLAAWLWMGAAAVPHLGLHHGHAAGGGGKVWGVLLLRQMMMSKSLPLAAPMGGLWRGAGC